MFKTIQELKLHDHTCLAFNNQIEFFHCAIPFINQGLKNNEKCYIVTDDITREEVLKHFKYLYRDGINPFDEISKEGRISIKHFKEVYLIDNRFDVERTIENYINLTNKALSKGFTAVRVFAELSSSLKEFVNLEEFLSYEEKVDKYFDENKFLAVCAYNKKQLPENFVSSILKSHTIQIDWLKTRL